MTGGRWAARLVRAARRPVMAGTPWMRRRRPRWLGLSGRPGSPPGNSHVRRWGEPTPTWERLSWRSLARLRDDPARPHRPGGTVTPGTYGASRGVLGVTDGFPVGWAGGMDCRRRVLPGACPGGRFSAGRARPVRLGRDGPRPCRAVGWACSHRRAGPAQWSRHKSALPRRCASGSGPTTRSPTRRSSDVRGREAGAAAGGGGRGLAGPAVVGNALARVDWRPRVRRPSTNSPPSLLTRATAVPPLTNPQPGVRSLPTRLRGAPGGYLPSTRLEGSQVR